MQILAAVLVLSTAAPALAGGKVALAYKSQPNTETQLQLRAKVAGSSTMTIGGEPEQVPIDFDMAVDFGWLGLAPSEPGQVAQEASLRQITIRVAGAGGPDQLMVVNSDGMTANGVPQDSGPIDPSLFIGSVAAMRFGATGDPMTIAPGEGLPEPFAEVFEMLSMLHPVLPTKKVKPGKSWKGSREVPISLPLKDPILPGLTYTLMDITDGMAVIKVQGQYEAGPGEQAELPNGMLMVPDFIRYAIDGECTLDIDTGTLQHATLEMKVQYSAHTEDGGMTLSVDMPSTYSFGPVPAAAP
ncbi:MAG: DUF6263 family protein [Myxococcota bacterium]